MLKPEIIVACIVEKDGRFLVVEERTERGIRFNQPAGHLEPGETIEQGALRETMEETACRVELTSLVAVNMTQYLSRGAEPASFLRFTFEAAFVEQTAAALDPDIIRTHWMTYEEVLACKDRHRSHLLLETIEKYRRGVRSPMTLLSTQLMERD